MDAGLFGGTFNPLHNGHLGIIEYVKTRCRLDKIFIFPSATPPHKPSDNLAPARDRLKMVEDAVQDLPGYCASDIELKRRGPSFTIDTIQAFQKAQGPDLNFHLLMGSDAFFDITTWKKKEKIFKAVPIIVMLRGEITHGETAAGEPAAGPTAGIDSIASFIDEQISKGYKLLGGNYFVHDHLKPIRICNVPRIDISSTQIRNRIKTGQSITGLVPKTVETLIRTKDLYK